MNEQFKGKLYIESQWYRCFVTAPLWKDGGWVVGEIEYQSGKQLVVNTDDHGEVIVPEEWVVEWQ